MLITVEITDNKGSIYILTVNKTGAKCFEIFRDGMWQEIGSSGEHIQFVASMLHGLHSKWYENLICLAWLPKPLSNMVCWLSGHWQTQRVTRLIGPVTCEMYLCARCLSIEGASIIELKDGYRLAKNESVLRGDE